MSSYQRWLNVFRTERLNGKLDDELAYHLAETAVRLTEQGIPEHEALRMARLQVGNYSIQKERTRNMNIAAWLDNARADIVYGFASIAIGASVRGGSHCLSGVGHRREYGYLPMVNAIRLKMLPV